MTIDKVKEYYKSEYQDAKRIIKDKVWWANPKEIVQNTIHRMLGVAMFAQKFDDVTYEEIELLYNFYKEELENLLTD